MPLIMIVSTALSEPPQPIKTAPDGALLLSGDQQAGSPSSDKLLLSGDQQSASPAEDALQTSIRI